MKNTDSFVFLTNYDAQKWSLNNVEHKKGNDK